ncbi:MAG: BlaI/MecI/CopY family transcriptional regulator [Ruminococcaceae bacterium]|nr:BlaI/MecI/CopY family transcriptional regulator [Oscillospiraceae bacterium]
MANKEFIKLPESELEVMQAIWALDAEGEKFISAGLIMKRFPALTRLKLTTVLTLITRLQMKGFISAEKIRRANCYTPLIDREEYRRFAAEDFVEKVYGSNRISLVAALVQTETLTEQDIAALKKLIDDLETK